MSVLTFWVLVIGIFGLDEESVSTKVVTLRLEKIGREVLGTIAVIPAERGAESRKGDAPQSPFTDDVSPAGLCLVDGLVEEVVEEQVFEIWIVAVGFCDILQEDRSNDAATAPHEGNRRLVELPLVFLCGLVTFRQHWAVRNTASNLRSGST